jgi:Macrophage killing protein with similarity to conjugation protein.
MVTALTVLTAVCAISVGVTVYAVMNKPEPRYFATRAEGGILPLTPVSEPILTTSEVTNFAVKAVTRALTLDFANYRQDLADAQRFFDQPEGWENYLRALETSTMLKYVINRRLISSAVANGATIINTGLDARGRYSWTVQVPLTVTYQSSSERSASNLLAEVVISRVPTHVAADAVAISRIVVQSGRLAN